MLGHSLPNEIYDLVKANKKVFVKQEKGKPLVSENFDGDCVAVILSKENQDLLKLSDDERKEMNDKNIIVTTVGSTKDYSEVFFPERYFENRPLIGRPFLHGLFDCYTLIRDYYVRNFNLMMPNNMQREWEWWNQGPNLYVENANNYNFFEVNDIKKHDLLVMSLGSPVPNHGAVYIGDGKLIHHIAGRFSTIEDLSTFYKTKISVVYRNSTI